MDLANNVNQASGSQIVTLRLDWGGAGLSRAHVVSSRAGSSFKLSTNSSLDFSAVTTVAS